MTANGVTGGDPGKVNVDGDTMTGQLLLDDDSPAASEAYVTAHLPSVPVASVNGQTGAVVLAATDVGADASGTAAGMLVTAKSYADGKVAGLGTAATRNVPTSGDATSTQVVLGSDSRLTGGGDGGGAVDSVNGQTGVVVLAASDVGAAADDDARLSDDRIPTAHASTHASDGTDVLTPAAIGAATSAALTAHETATDPHGDRAYTDSAITALDLGTAAKADTTDFDAAGSATTAQGAAEAFTLSAITDLALGSASTADTSDFDAAGAAVDARTAAEAYTDTAIEALGDAASLDVGTAAGTVAAGDDSRLSDTRTPTDGSVTGAKLAAGAVTNVAISGSAAIALSKLATDPLARTNHTGVQTSSTISDFSSAASAAAPVQSVAGRSGAVTLAAADVTGVATLDVGGKLTASQLPAIAIVDYLGSAANQAAMLALSGQQGDWCTRTDLGTTWIITDADPTQLASWTQLSYPVAPVSSVNGATGVVVLAASDVGADPAGAADAAQDAAEAYTDTQITGLGLGTAAAADTSDFDAAGTAASAVGALGTAASHDFSDFDAAGAADSAQSAAESYMASAISGLNLGTASTHSSSDFDSSGAAATAQSAAEAFTTSAIAALNLGSASTHAAPASGNATGAQVVLASDTRLSDTRTPSDNSVTSAKIADGSIVDGDISASAAIALSKLATNPLARANHTGTQTASTISDLAAAIDALYSAYADITPSATNTAQGTPHLQYRTEPGKVTRLQGQVAISGGTATGTIFTIPVGARPAATTIIQIRSSGTGAAQDLFVLNTDGTVTTGASLPSGGNLNFDNVTFGHA